MYDIQAGEGVHPDHEPSAWDAELASPVENWQFSGLVTKKRYTVNQFVWQEANDGTHRWFNALRAQWFCDSMGEARWRAAQQTRRNELPNSQSRVTYFIQIDEVTEHTGVHWPECGPDCDAEHGWIPTGGARTVDVWEMFATRDDGSCESGGMTKAEARALVVNAVRKYGRADIFAIAKWQDRNGQRVIEPFETARRLKTSMMVA